METRFQLSGDDGVTWLDAQVDNSANIGVSFERNLDEGQAFFRATLSGNPVVRGDAYGWLYQKERGLDRCAEVLIRFQQKCGAGWKTLYTGVLSAGACEWDLDACSVTIKSKPKDRYSCIIDASDKRVNILQVAPVETSVPFVLGDLEVYACTDCEGVLDCQPPGDPLAINWLWRLLGQESFAAGACTCWVRVWGRRKATTICVGGNPVPPAGTGWVLLEDNCDTDGTATYVKQLSDDDIFLLLADIVEGTCVDGVVQPPDCNAYLPIFQCGETVSNETCPTPTEIPYKWVCFGAAGVAYDRGRPLKDVLEYLIEQTGCGDITGISSDFFGINPTGDAPGYVAGMNYVTGLPTQTEGIVVFQKTDVIDPDATNPATIGEMTWEELRQSLWVMFRVLWDITPGGVLRLEHWSFFASQQGPAIAEFAEAIEPLKYKHLSDQIPRIERGKFMEAQSRDFVGLDIVYDRPCATKNEAEEWDAGRITTDLGFIATDPAAISKDGFVLIATVPNGSGGNTAIVDTGAITGNFATNAPLSWANLQRDFWQDDRYLPSGNMNGQDINFRGFRPNIEQEDVSIDLCCRYSSFDAAEYMTTRLGLRLGIQRAEIESMEYSPRTGRSEITFRYAY